SARARNACNLCVKLRNGSASRTPGCADLCKFVSGRVVKGQNMTIEVDIEDLCRRVPESVTALARRQSSNPVKNLSSRDGCRKHRRTRLLAQPFKNSGLRARTQDFREDVRVEHDHLSKSTGSRMASRGAISRSTPPNGAMRARIAWTRS